MADPSNREAPASRVSEGRGVVTAILVDGREVACNAPVKLHHRWKFEALGRRSDTRAVLFHWTGGRGLGPKVFRTLQERQLSVHFNIDPDGTIWQFADCSLRCSHAGVANGWSIGVEMTNLAGPRLVRGDSDRAVVVESIHGTDAKHTTFTPAQTASALALGEAICCAYGLPLAVPLGPDGDVYSTVLPVTLRNKWRGVLGHLHISERKRDPGLTLLRAFAALAPRAVIGLTGAAE